MKKSILILFVLLSQVCMGQDSGAFHGMTLENRITIPDNPNYIMKTVEYYQKSDSTITALKNKLSEIEAKYDKLIKDLDKLKK